MNFRETVEVLNCLRQVDDYLRTFSLGTNEIWQRISDNITMLEEETELYKKAPDFDAMEKAANEMFEAGFELCRKMRVA